MKKFNINYLILVIGLLVVATAPAVYAAPNDVTKVTTDPATSHVDGGGSLMLDTKTGQLTVGRQTDRNAPSVDMHFVITLESGQNLIHVANMRGAGASNQLPGGWGNAQSAAFSLTSSVPRYPTSHCDYRTSPGNNLYYKQEGSQYGFHWSDGAKKRCGPIRVINAVWFINNTPPASPSPLPTPIPPPPTPIPPPPTPTPPVVIPPQIIYQAPVYNPPIYQPPIYQTPIYYQLPTFYYPQVYNQPPVWIPVPNQTVNVGRVLQFTVLAVDPNNDYINYRVGTTMPVGASFNNETRTFMWTPSSNQLGIHTAVFIASDGYSSVDMSVYIHVTEDSAKLGCFTPSFTNDVIPSSVKEGQLYTATVSANGGGITYKIINGPQGLTINPNFGIIVWLPNFSQGKSESYPVTVSVTNCQGEVTKTFNITVQDIDKVYTPPPVVSTCADDKLLISNIEVNKHQNNVVVSWNTNKPASSGLMYDVVSKADLTKNFNYSNSSPIDYNLTTDHKVVLPISQADETYYFRVSSKTDCDALIISSERILTPLYYGWYLGWCLSILLFLILLALMTAIVILIIKK